MKTATPIPDRPLRDISVMKKIFSFSFLLLAVPYCAFSVEIVKDGKAVSEIVLPLDACASVQTAGSEIQHSIEAMSGAKLPIVNVASPDVANQIFVGESEATRKLGFELGNLKYDGFKIVAAKNHVIVAGKDISHFTNSFSKFKDLPKNERQKAWETFTGKKWRLPPMLDFRDFNEDCGIHLIDATGTLYGAYELLGQLGMRWYMPNPEIGLVIPKLSNISIADQTTTREPEFPVRLMGDSGNGFYKNEFLWYKSMGVGSAFIMPAYHSLSGPLKVEPETQPQEYYGTVNGKINYLSPRLTNERLRADTIEYLELVDKGFPGIDYTCIGQPDGWSLMDSTDAALGWNKVADRGADGAFSDYYWDFIMDIRGRYMQRHPDRKFTVFAYSSTQRVPTNVDKIPENVSVIFCQNARSWMLPNRVLANREEWLAKMSHKEQLLIWEYYTLHAPKYNFPPVPVFFTKYLKQSFDGLYDKAAGVLAEVGWTSPAVREREKLVLSRPGISHLLLYIHNRLCWDRNLDVKAVLEEYYSLFYGPASAEMKEFFEFAESVWNRPEPREISASGGFLKAPDVDRYFEILGRANEKAGDTVYRKRIALITAEMEPLKQLFEKLKRTGPNIQIKTTKETPTIDGDLTKPFWRAEPHTFIPLKTIASRKVPPELLTSVSFRWANDNSALFIAVECMEPNMDQIRDQCKSPDSKEIFSDDTVEVRLETPSGIRPLIVINPAGTILDECVMEDAGYLPSFYKVSESSVKKFADRWTVELRIDAMPISGVRPVPFYPWGVNVCRQRLASKTPELHMLSPSGTSFKDPKFMANIFVRK